LSGYNLAGQSRYLAVWTRDLPLPVSGTAVPDLAAFDRAMLTYMKERGVRAGALAVMKDGRLILQRGYGWAARDGSRQVQPDDPFRLASVTKPFTAAAVRNLIRRGKLSLDTRVFALLGVKPPPGRFADPRLAHVTVRHLLDHRGGWDRDVGPV